MRDRKRGFSLAVTMVVLMIMSVIGMAVAAMGSVNLGQIQSTERSSALLHAANGGLSELMDRLYREPDYGAGVTDSRCNGTGTYLTSSGLAYYWWTFQTTASLGYCVNNLEGNSATAGYQGRTVPPMAALLVVNADWVPREFSRRPVTLACVASKAFRLAVATDGTMDVRTVVGTNGLPSSVWSNSTASTTIEATSIDGQAFTAGGPGSIDVSGTLAGLPHYNAGRLPMPDIPIDSIVASYKGRDDDDQPHPYGGPAFFQAIGPVEFETGTDGTLFIRSGTVYNDRGHGQIVNQIAPPPPGQPDVEIYLPAGVTFRGGATIAPRMQFFVQGDMSVGGSLTQLPTTYPDDNFFFVTGAIRFNGSNGSNLNMLAGTGIVQNGSSNYSGLLYIRNGDFDINGGGVGSNYQGTVIVRGTLNGTGDLDAGAANFSYNPLYLTALERYHVSISGNTPVYVLSWWVLR